MATQQLRTLGQGAYGFKPGLGVASRSLPRDIPVVFPTTPKVMRPCAGKVHTPDSTHSCIRIKLSGLWLGTPAPGRLGGFQPPSSISQIFMSASIIPFETFRRPPELPRQRSGEIHPRQFGLPILPPYPASRVPAARSICSPSSLSKLFGSTVILSLSLLPSRSVRVPRSRSTSFTRRRTSSERRSPAPYCNTFIPA